MGSSGNQSKELQAFLAFAKAAQLAVSDMVQEPAPPAPDILANIAGELTAYEVTEAIDREYARKFSLMVKTPKLVREVYANLPSDKRGEIEERHAGKIIGFCFRDDLPLRKREAILPSAFDYVLNLDPEVGSQELARIEDPMPELHHISASQIGWDGIRWEANPTASWIDPETALRDRLVDKMANKSYQTEHPIELLVYFWREVTPPPNTGWVEAMKQVAGELLAASPFRRVWLYDGWTEATEILADTGKP